MDQRWSAGMADASAHLMKAPDKRHANVTDTSNVSAQPRLTQISILLILFTMCWSHLYTVYN